MDIHFSFDFALMSVIRINGNVSLYVDQHIADSNKNNSHKYTLQLNSDFKTIFDLKYTDLHGLIQEPLATCELNIVN